MTTNDTATITSSSKNLSVDCLLTKDNYLLWKFKLLPVFLDEQLASIHEDTNGIQTVTLQDSHRAMRALTLNISNDLAAEVTHFKKAQDVWDFFHESFSGLSYSRKHLGIQKLCAFRHQKGSVRASIAELRTILNEIVTAAASKSITYEELAIAMLLNSLPPSYSNQRSSITADKVTSLDQVQIALVKEEEIINAAAAHENQFAGSAVNTGFNRSWPSGTTLCTHNWNADTCKFCHPNMVTNRQKRINNLINAKCTDCGKSGHRSKMSHRCTMRSGEELVGHTAHYATNDDEMLVPFKEHQSALVAVKSSFKRRASMDPSDLRYVLDSGCTTSLSKNKANLKHYSTVLSEIQVADTTAPKLRCEGNGELNLTSHLSLKNVLYAPNVTLNLLSVAQLADLDCRIVFDKNGCKVEHTPTGRVLLNGKREGNLYVYTQTQQGHAYLATESPPSKMELFHRRMGHINYRDLRQLVRLADGVTLEKSQTSECTHCILAKSHRRHFGSSTSHAKRFGEITHTDVCYVGIPALNGDFTMFILFIDDATRFTVIYLLRSKSDSAAAFFDYDKKVLNFSGRHCQILKSDGGTEYFNSTVRTYCQQFGIIQNSSDRYTPQGNGRAERPNRTTLEGTSAMLFDCGLSMEYWGYAALCFIYLKNRSPHSALRHCTPYEAKFGKLPDLSNVRVFGSAAYVHVPAQLRKGAGSKLQPKANAMIFVGYSDVTNSWKMLDPKTMKVITTSEAYFLEDFGTNRPRHTVKFIDYVTSSNTTAGAPSIHVSQSHVSTDNQSSSEYGGEHNHATASQDQLSENSDNESEASNGTPGQNSDVDDNRSEASDSSEDPLTALTLPMDVHVQHLILHAAQDIITENDTPTYAEAMSGPYKHQYQKAILKEFDSLFQHKVFSEPCNLPSGFIPLDTKLVLRRKLAERIGEERICKARLCGKGFKQIFGVDYFETFSPVATYDALRIFLILMIAMDYEIDCVDVITAFLLAPLKEEVYIKIPDGYPNKHKFNGKVIRLLKSLYGLKQSPHEWNKELDTFLQFIGFKSTESEKCIYVGRFGTKGETTIYLLVYVDDILIACPDRTTMAKLKSMINKKFPIKDKGPLSFFLNMHFKRDRSKRTITLHQQPKIEKLLLDPRLTKEERLLVSKPCRTPASDDEVLTTEMCATTDEDKRYMSTKNYKSFIGILLYIAITARPDISPAVSVVARFAQNPGNKHWDAVLRILRYLQGTRTMVLQLSGSSFKGDITDLTTLAYADADWGKDLDTRRSRSGYAIYLLNSLIIWSSKLQASTALSSTEAEYIALATCARITIWLRTLLSELGFPQHEPTRILEDNKSTINIAESMKAHPAVKHIDIRHHFIRDRVMNIKDIKIIKESTHNMVADLFTKQLPYPAFKKHRDALGLISQ
jgi:hypothetical protein